MQTIGMIFDNLAEIVEAAILVYFFIRCLNLRKRCQEEHVRWLLCFLLCMRWQDSVLNLS